MADLSFSGIINSPAHVKSLRVALCVVSLVIYASLALLHDQSDAPATSWAYATERPPIASAISNVVYGAPLASVYRGLFNAFNRPVPSIDDLVEKAKHKVIDAGELIPYDPNGVGAGEAIYLTAVMRVFGIHTSSIVWAFVTLISISTLGFLLRFNDSRALVVIAGFSALTIMFASLLGTTEAGIIADPVGGYRYFSLLAAIPGMHIVLEVWDRETVPKRQEIRRLFLLLVQLLIFSLTYYVSIATVYLYGPLLLAIAYSVHRLWRKPAGFTWQMTKVLLVAGVAVAMIFVAKDVAPRAYKETGRNGDSVWTRVFVAMGFNPHWPFGTLAEEYKGCWPGMPERTLQPGYHDDNAHCAWFEYAKRHGIPESQSGKKVFDKDYNTAIKEAFFDAAKQYPVDTLLTFIYYKPLLLARTLYQLFDFTHPLPVLSPRSIPRLVLIFIAAQISMLIAFAFLEANAGSPRQLGYVCATFALFGICSCGLYIIAWASPVTTVDLFFNILASLASGLVTIIAVAARASFRLRGSLSSVGSGGDILSRPQ